MYTKDVRNVINNKQIIIKLYLPGLKDYPVSYIDNIC